jgi:DNA modification methylase
MKPYYQDKDCLIFNADYLDVLQDQFANVVITDPPYGVNYQNNYTHNKFDKIENDGDRFSYYPWARRAYTCLADNSALLAYTGWSTYPQHFLELQEAGFAIKEPLIVQKRHSGTTDLYGSFQTNSDWLLFAHKGKFKFKPTQLLKNKRAGTIPNKGRKPVPEYKMRFPACWFGEKFPFSTENPAKKINHPTPKSVEFMQWLIQLTTNEGDVVLDPFMGSGTTLLAARAIGRRCIGIEISNKYCDLAISRLRN